MGHGETPRHLEYFKTNSTVVASLYCLTSSEVKLENETLILFVQLVRITRCRWATSVEKKEPLGGG